MESNNDDPRRLDGRTVSGLQQALREQAIRAMNRGGRSHHGRGGGRHRGRPPGLRGREIGMFYRQRAMEREQQEELESFVLLQPEIIAKVQKMLSEYDSASTSTFRSEFENYFKSIRSTSFEQNMKEKLLDSSVEQDDRLDEKMMVEYDEMMDNSKFQENMITREKLPVNTKKEEILNAIASNQVVLISGDTGCGKTTQVPQYVLDSYLSSGKASLCKIFCTQPRRISAITVAERVAWERAQHLGESVGYQIRLQSVLPHERGSITYCTTGILLKRLESDPLLNGISHIFLDEVHERDVNTDVVMGLLKEIISHRPDLKVILMSATFNTSTFSEYFNNCTNIEVQGTLFPVTEFYLEDVLEETKFANFPEEVQRKRPKWEKYRNKYKQSDSLDDYTSFIEPYARSVQDKYSKFVIEGIKNPNSEKINVDLLTALIFHISFNKPAGAILVFLPGYEAISKLHTSITNSKFYSAEKFKVYALHSMMPTADQKSVFSRPPENVRKVIISTNIAETSITIDDVVYVINSGKSKMTNYNPETKLQTLEEVWTTLANNKQRRGRAGRVQPGICYHLFTRAREFTMDALPTPEILRTRLESVILNLKMLRIHDVAQFLRKLVSVPDDSVVQTSIALLKRLNALDEREFITPLGLHLARLPIDPQIGKMILLAALFKCVDPITSVAANLSFKDPFYRPLGKEKLVDDIRVKFSKDTKSDHLMAANVITEYREEKRKGNERSFCYDNFLSISTLNQLEKMKGQFTDLLMEARFLESSDPTDPKNNYNSSNLDLLRSIISAGLYPNVAKVRRVKVCKRRVDPRMDIITPEDGRVSFHPSSINSKQTGFEYKFFAYFMKQKSTAIYLFDTTMINPRALLIFGDGEGAGFDQLGNHFILLGDSFRFRTNRVSAEVILKLREKFDELLQKKAINPGPVDPESEDALLLGAITEVLNAGRFSGHLDYSSDEGNVM